MTSLTVAEQIPDEVRNRGGLSPRGNGRGEQIIMGVDVDQAAREGSLFVVRNATLATGIAQTANTTEDTTKPFITGSNPATAKKQIELVRLEMRPTAVASGQVIQNFSLVTCDGVAYASAGTDYNVKATGLNAVVGYLTPNQGINLASVLSVLRVGVPVTVLGSNAKAAARWSTRRTTIPVIQDRYIATFGNWGGAGGENNSIEPVGTTIDVFFNRLPPCIVPPGTSFMLIPWAASIGSAMSWEFELWWVER